MKKSKAPTGRLLIKSRFKGRKHQQPAEAQIANLQDHGSDWARLNLCSVTDQSSMEEFFDIANLAGTEFSAEKRNIQVVNVQALPTKLNNAQLNKMNELNVAQKDLLLIPRRPPWNPEMPNEDLIKNEKADFLEWRRKLAELDTTNDHRVLTPFEKNLEVWRQLWRVVEKSDVLVQIVDARNPLLYRCEDLEKYVLETGPHKKNLIVINKADFLSTEQRQTWADYFTKNDIRVVFYSAVLASESSVGERRDGETDKQNSSENHDNDHSHETSSNSHREASDDTTKSTLSEELEESVKSLEEASNDTTKSTSSEELEESAKSLEEASNDTTKSTSLQELKESVKSLEEDVERAAEKLDRLLCNNSTQITPLEARKVDAAHKKNSSEILTRDQFIELLRTFHDGPKTAENVTSVGFVGYPNVGKSSTINSLLGLKKVSVSATPGHTKHLQTHFLTPEKDLLAYDCPGLVMPSFVSTKAEMFVNGIMPIDQMRDPMAPTQLVCNLIPRHVLERKYNLVFPSDSWEEEERGAAAAAEGRGGEEEEQSRSLTAEELLSAYGYNRGFMTARGLPDQARAARYILKDYLNGKLLYCQAPPGIDQKMYQKWPEAPPKKVQSAETEVVLPPRYVRAVRPNRVDVEKMDKAYFTGILLSGTKNAQMMDSMTGDKKSYKQINKHKNKNKREKTRRVYAHLDQH